MAALAMGALGGMMGTGGGGNGGQIPEVSPPTERQRAMFTQPVTLSKRQKAKLKKKKN